MRIVHYYPTARVDSGVTIALWGWAGALAQAGVEVAVLHGGAGGELGPRLFDSATRVRSPVHEAELAHRGGGRMTRRPVGLERHLRPGDVLVLHEGWVVANLVAARIARRMAVPYVITPHGVYNRSWRSYLRPPLRVREWLEKDAIEHALAVHVFFDSEIPDIVELAPRAAFVVAPTGCDVPVERWAGGGGYLSWIGRFDPVHKGLDVLVEAVATLPVAERPRVRMHGYDYRGGLAALHRLIGERAVADSFQVEGVVSGSEKTAFLRHADGYVHPSRWEAQSIAIMENLALGVPSLISSTAQIAPDLQAANAALLADPRPDSLADGLRQLRAHGQGLGERGRALVAERFSWDRLAASYLDQLTGLIARR